MDTERVIDYFLSKDILHPGRERNKVKCPKDVASNGMEHYCAMFIASSECLSIFTKSYFQFELLPDNPDEARRVLSPRQNMNNNFVCKVGEVSWIALKKFNDK